MAVSGTVSTTELNVAKLIELSYRRCRVIPQKITPEHVEIAKDQLYLMLSQLSARGIQLWCLEKQYYGLNQGLAGVPLDVGTVDVSNVNRRQLTRYSANMTSSDGGTVDYASDDDTETVFTQVAPDGDLQYDFLIGDQTEALVEMCGVLGYGSAAHSLSFEVSEDAVTWVVVGTSGAFTSTDLKWRWFAFDGNLAHRYFRIRETAGGTLNFREIVVGGSCTDIPLYRMSKDEYEFMPNKLTQGLPVQFYLDRQRDYPIMRLWPTTQHAWQFTMAISLIRQRYLMDVGALTDTLDIPQRWMEFVVSRLAYMCAQNLTGDEIVGEDVIARLQSNWMDAERIAMNEERDNSPIYFNPNIGAYTR